MNLKYISRIDTYNTHGYQVRMPLIKDGTPTRRTKDEKNKFFSDSLYKDSKKKAINYRNNYLTRNKCKHLLKVKASFNSQYDHSTRNTSGVIGVHLSLTVKKCGSYYGFKAQYQIEGAQARKEYSCNLYGYEGAFLKACHQRYINAGTLIITDIDALPCLPTDPYELEL